MQEHTMGKSEIGKIERPDNSCRNCGKHLLSAFRGKKVTSELCRPCWEKEWQSKRREVI